MIDLSLLTSAYYCQGHVSADSFRMLIVAWSNQQQSRSRQHMYEWVNESRPNLLTSTCATKPPWSIQYVQFPKLKPILLVIGEHSKNRSRFVSNKLLEPPLTMIKLGLLTCSTAPQMGQNTLVHDYQSLKKMVINNGG